MTGSSAQVAPATETPAPAEPYYEDYDEDEYDPAQESLLRNPYVLAALAVAGAIFLAIVVVILAGGGSGSGGAAIATPDPLTPRLAGITIDSISTATVREGPGTDYAEVGTLPRGQKVSVTGRDDDGKWFQIVFPQNSSARGWVPSSALKVADLNVPGLAVVAVTPLSRPTPIPPTPVPLPTEAATATAVATGTAVPGPDIAVSMNCAPGANVAVSIRNAGEAPLTNRVASVSVLIGGQVRSTNVVQLSLDPDATVTMPTDQVITAPTTAVQVTLQGSPTDVNPSNNGAECILQAAPTPSQPLPTSPAGQPTPTPTVQTVAP